jgi:hypothetical protein
MIAAMSGDRPISSAPRSRSAAVLRAFLGLRPVVRFYVVGGIVLAAGIVSGYASDSSKGIGLGIVAGTIGMWAYLGLGMTNPANR